MITGLAVKLAKTEIKYLIKRLLEQEKLKNADYALIKNFSGFTILETIM